MELPHFSHKHPLTFFDGQNTHSDAENTKCSGCLGPILEESSYGCTQCHYFLHKKCAELPREIFHPFHPEHRLRLQPHQQGLRCALCFSGRQSMIYHCSLCHYSLHIKCAEISPPAWMRNTPSRLHFIAVKGVISSLHKTCPELPIKKPSPFHPHTLTLRPKSPHSNRVFACNVCSTYSNGFSYNCKRCSFDLDLRCSSISDTLIHQAHEHSLFAFFLNDDVLYCQGCGTPGKNGLYCHQCVYVLDFKCAALPPTAMHSYDDHPLKLTFKDDSDSDQLYCDVCEDKRDPKHWFYYCDDCGVTIHPECVFGKYPYIKVGDTYTIESHPHSLRFVNKTEKYPSCNSCGQPCSDLALECVSQSECSFIVHWECVAPNKS
ncbi:uncharacterized protein LOC110819936 [Carica papaya]|uniref:uncharacterized protein LOC110819936 n=1 Tax=Carica papaya TaxID=3649 RepID=UPI000B8D0E98|nr:uncharacterized protein LOC110819936 [Carica papaya]